MNSLGENMLKFDASKVRFDYVKVSKITSNSVYVVCDRDGNEYEMIQAPRSTHNGRLVRKLKIHERVARGYFLYNSLKEFSAPQMACLFVYDGEVLSIEIQRLNYQLGYFEDQATWVCYAERCMSRLKNIVSNKDDVFINGTEIFWPSRDSEGELYNTTRLDASDNFHLCFVDYVRLNRVGLASYIRRENKLLKGLENPTPEVIKPGEDGTTAEKPAVQQAKKDDVDDKYYEGVMLVVQSGSVLRYSADGATAYSPVLKNDLKVGRSYESESKQLYPLFASDSIMKPNLTFVKMAGTVIGGIYGMKAVDFLNIPEIIEKTGEVCLFNIDERHSGKICLDMEARTCLAWILGFLGQETRLNEMHSLNRLFRSSMRSGFSKMGKLGEIDATKEVIDESVLPLVSYRPALERQKERDERLERYMATGFVGVTKQETIEQNLGVAL